MIDVNKFEYKQQTYSLEYLLSAISSTQRDYR